MQSLNSIHHPDTPCTSGPKAKFFHGELQPALKSLTSSLRRGSCHYPDALVRRRWYIPGDDSVNLWSIGRVQGLSTQELALGRGERLFVHATTLGGSCCWIQVNTFDLCACSMRLLAQHAKNRTPASMT